MSIVADRFDPAASGTRLRGSSEITPALIDEMLQRACRRLRLPWRDQRTDRLVRLVEAAAWTEAALLLIELELPFWKVRRIIYDDGEWCCALSQARELPDWIDQSVEARHPDLAVALLCALTEAQVAGAETDAPSTASASGTADVGYTPICCDNFR
jgi:hypothetical protein